MTEFCPTCAGPKSAEWSTDWGHCDDPFHSPSLADRLAQLGRIHWPSMDDDERATVDEAVEALRTAEEAMTAELGEGKIVAWIEKYGGTDE